MRPRPLGMRFFFWLVETGVDVVVAVEMTTTTS
jgi:hypothetical protein